QRLHQIGREIIGADIAIVALLGVGAAHRGTDGIDDNGLAHDSVPPCGRASMTRRNAPLRGRDFASLSCIVRRLDCMSLNWRAEPREGPDGGALLPAADAARLAGSRGSVVAAAADAVREQLLLSQIARAVERARFQPAEHF